MWACTATLRRHQLVSVSPLSLLNKISSFFPSFSNIKQHTHTTTTTTTTTTRQIQEAYDQAKQSHPKTLDTNPSQKEIPTAIGEKQKKQTKNKKTREPSKQPFTNSVQQKYSNQSSSSLCVPHTTVEHV